jgi:hypothetical protein
MTAYGLRLTADGRSRGSLVLLAALAALLSASCGYTLAGHGSALPEAVKTIGIPDFVNHTPYYAVGQTLSQRVRTELIGRGKYKVLPQATGVDAVLKAQINSITLTPTAFNSSQQAIRYAISVSLGIELVQAADGKVLWQNQNQVFREEYPLASGGSVLDPATFLGQASNAIDRMATDCARSVVSSILEGF